MKKEYIRPNIEVVIYDTNENIMDTVSGGYDKDRVVDDDRIVM